MFAFLHNEIRVLLGQWSITSVKVNNIKIDWANIDNCGITNYK